MGRDRTIKQAKADAQKLLAQHYESGSRLRPLTKRAWMSLGERCIQAAVNAGDDEAWYQESVTLAGLCVAKAREMKSGANERKLARTKWRKNKGAS